MIIHVRINSYQVNEIIHQERNGKMKNIKVRTEITKCGMKIYEVAELLGITGNSLSRKLAKELPKAEQKRIIDAIRAYKKGVSDDE